MRWLPDWLVYLVVTAAVLLALFRVDQRATAPAWRDAEIAGAGALLPPPSVFDPELLVEVGPSAPGLGTAFAVNREGWWLTARHVVDGCAKVGVQVSRGRALPAEVLPARFADLAFLRTEPVPSVLPMNLDEANLKLGQEAYHVGFPQGRPGEAASRLIGRERLIARGRYSLEEPVLAWSEMGRTLGLNGSLAGMSGGPTLDGEGRVIGVTIAESPRRGRIYTASPATIMRWMEISRVESEEVTGAPLTARNYGQRADAMRRTLTVRPVICDTRASPPERAGGRG
ncbi:MAG: S1 family peptidase [Caulobacterales bacterium]